MIPNERVRHAAARDAFLEYLRSDFDSTSEKLIFFKQTLEIIKELLTEEPANLKLVVKAARKQIRKKTKAKSHDKVR